MSDRPDTSTAEPTLLVSLTDLVNRRLTYKQLLRNSVPSQECQSDVIKDTIKGELWNVRTDEMGAKFGELMAEYPTGPPTGEAQKAFNWPHPPSLWHEKLGEYLAQAIAERWQMI